jgi:dehydrogenase/reductase SDR family protein 7B
MSHYNQKVVWVTGASSGIGESLVKELIKQNAFIIASARRASELTRIKNECGVGDDRFFVLPLDLSRQSTFDDVTSKAISWKGYIDILINNGGISQRAKVVDTTLDVERSIFEVNYFGTVELTRKILPFMMERRQGHVSVVSSVLGKLSVPGRSSYCSSKHALHGYFDALRAEVHAFGIGVSIVCPGYIKTNVSKNALTADGSHHRAMDSTQEKGMDSDKFSRKMLKKIARGRNEFNIGGPEIYAIYLMRFIPWLVFWVQRNIKF